MRGARARLLAGRYPASREALLFYAAVVAWQGELAASLPPSPDLDSGPALDSLLPGRRALVELVAEHGPEKLRQQARGFDDPTCREALRAYYTRQDTDSPRSFFARVLLQPAMFCWERSPREDSAEAPARRTADGEAAALCPHCGHPPQVGCLRPEGDGLALALVCSLCLRDWAFARSRCPGCGNADHHKIGYYSTPAFAQLQVQVCESCCRYLHLVDSSKEKQAIADVDELTALPLDLWAAENGYRKLQPNLAGI